MAHIDEVWFTRQLEILNTTIATTMVHGFKDPIDLTVIEDDRFQSVLYGLSVMVNDINITREQLTEQNYINQARADLWQLASDATLTEQQFIQKLLNILGPVMRCERIGFSVVRKDKLICTVEWCKEGVASTLNAIFPYNLIRYFLRDDFTELDVETALERLPSVIRPFARMFYKKIMASQNISSIAYIPFLIQYYEQGFISFDMRQHATHTPVWNNEKRQLVREAVRIVTLVIEQRRTRIALIRSYDELEDRVQKRTLELHRVNSTLEGSVQEKEVLLKEIHHRVKNNLQIISSLLNLQARHLKDPQDANLFVDSQNRIRSMALIHERLYQTGDLAHIRFDTYINRLVANLFQTYAINTQNVICTQAIDPVEMTVDRAIPCSLILNELISNTFKHVFNEGKKGALDILLKQEKSGTHVVLTVKDDGPGMPQDVEAHMEHSLGLELVHTLTDQLDGELTLTNTPGATFTLRFPLEGSS